MTAAFHVFVDDDEGVFDEVFILFEHGVESFVDGDKLIERGFGLGSAVKVGKVRDDGHFGMLTCLSRSLWGRVLIFWFGGIGFRFENFHDFLEISACEPDLSWDKFESFACGSGRGEKGLSLLSRAIQLSLDFMASMLVS